MADRLEMFAPTRGFLGMADSIIIIIIIILFV